MSGFQPPPQRHWRNYGTEPLPTARGALDLPLRAFPSWFLRITCERCGKATMMNEAHTNEQPASSLNEPMVAMYLNCRGRGAIPNRRHALPSLQGGADGHDPFRRAGPAHTARPVGCRAVAALG